MLGRPRSAAQCRDAGFTLVELIVVVVILGVLAAIAVPVYLNQAQNARKQADMSAISAAKVAVVSYMEEVGGGNNAPNPATQLAEYGFPATPPITIASYSSITGTYTLDIDASKSQSHLQCQATQLVAPHCW